MSELIQNQNYGVEVEFTGITREMATNAVAEVLQSRRILGPERNCYHTRKVVASDGRKWTVMRDSSINPERKVGTEPLDEYRVEFVTPILRYEDMETLQTILRKFREIGGKTNSSCGIHVHVDGANHSPRSLKNMINFMFGRQDLIYEALQVGDRKNRWCKPICQSLRQTIQSDRQLTKDRLEHIWYSSANDRYYGSVSHEHYNETRYHALNLHSFFSKGTVEFRLFNSTLHAGKVKAYVQFCLAVSAWAIETETPVVFRTMDGYTPEQKVTIMYHILTNRLGLYGDEYKTCRLHWMSALKENAQRAQAA